MDLKEFIEVHVTKVEPLEKVGRMAWWNLATTGDENYSLKMKEANIAIRKVYSSSEDYRFLSSQSIPSEPFLKRQLKLLLNSYLENQIPHEMIAEIVSLESEVETIYTNFRPVVENQPLSNNDLKQILVESTDSEKRKAAWEASKLIGAQVQEKVLKLVGLRNSSAKKAGFDNYYTMSLELQELDEDKLFNMLEELEQLSNPFWTKYKNKLDQNLCGKYGIHPHELMPWHYHDPFFQEAPQQVLDMNRFYKGQDIAELSRLYFQNIGLNVDDILARSDLYEREQKNQHAFCTCIDRKEDIRILCNLRDNEYWMGTQLHELGHAVYDKYIDQSLPYLLRTYAHISSTESIAMLFGRLSKSGDFLHRYCGVSQEEANRIDAFTKQQLASNLLVFARWVLVMVNFERAMYQQPTANLNQLWWDYVERFQGVNRVPSRDQPDWAAKLHLACAPVYYQNYILGEMTASQLKHAIDKILDKKNENFCNSLKIGEFLQTKLFNLGARYEWNEAIQYATGEQLNPHYFVQDISLI
jgi:peptidyl-dipeptidase A